MKTTTYLSFLLLLTASVNAQVPDSTIKSSDSILVQPKDTIPVKDTLPIIERAADSIPSANNPPKENTAEQPRYNKYGDLLNDDPVYNKKSSWLVPALRVTTSNAFIWALDKYLFKFDWASSGPKDWKKNFRSGPEWDPDGFGMNFIGHPYHGSIYFNTARSNGFSYWGSFPYAVLGSLQWEYLAENTRPSYNDFINTPISGAFLGEALYRISSNILDDRTRGVGRFWREVAAGIINPTRALNRLTQGKMFRVTSSEVYQKEPINVTLSMGVHKVNDKIGHDNKFATGQTNFMLNTQIDYGDPFETRRRKPFDLFRLRLELSYGDDRHVIDHVNGYGLLAGKNLKEDRLLGGLFQHYDFWHNNIFEVATLGFGYGLISRMLVSKNSTIYSTLHLAAVPLAGNNTQFGPVDSKFRHYNYGGGVQGKIEEMINIGKWSSLGFTGFFYWIHTYDGQPGNSLVGILKPTVALRLFKNLSLGFEHHIYKNRRFLDDENILNLTRTEQKLYLQLFFEDGKRKGRYH